MLKYQLLKNSQKLINYNIFKNFNISQLSHLYSINRTFSTNTINNHTTKSHKSSSVFQHQQKSINYRNNGSFDGYKQYNESTEQNVDDYENIKLPIFQSEEEVIQYYRELFTSNIDLARIMLTKQIESGISFSVLEKLVKSVIPKVGFNAFMLNRILNYYINYQPKRIEEILNLYRTHGVDYNIKTYTSLLEFKLKNSTQEELAQFVKEIFRSKLFLGNKITSLLIDYYIMIGDHQRATQFFEKKLRSPTPEKQNTTKETIQMAQILLAMVNNRKLFEDSLEFCKNNIGQLPEFYKGYQLLRYLKALLDHQQTDSAMSLIEYLEKGEMLTLETGNNLILFYMETGNFTTANLLYYKLLSLHQPNLQSFIPFIRYSMRQREKVKLKAYIKEMDSYQIEMSDDLIYNIIDFFIKEGEISVPSKLINKMVNNNVGTKSFVKVLSQAELLGNQAVVNLLLQPFTVNAIQKKNFVFIARFTSDIIIEYLVLDEFQRAMKWYETRATTYKLLPNFRIIFAFTNYHQIRREEDLMKYWTQKMAEYSLVKNREDEFHTKKAFERYFKIRDNSFKEFLEFDIERLLNQTADAIQPNYESKNIKPLTFSENYSSYSMQETVLNELFNSGNIKDIRNILAHQLNHGYIPSQEMVDKILSEMYRRDPVPNNLMAWVHSIPEVNRPLRFVKTAHIVILRNNLEFGLSLLDKEEFILYSSTNGALWCGILEGLYKINNLDLSISILQALIGRSYKIPMEMIYKFGVLLLRDLYLNQKGNFPYVNEDLEYLKELGTVSENKTKSIEDDFSDILQGMEPKVNLEANIDAYIKFYQTVANNRSFTKPYLHLPIFNCILRILISQQQFERGYQLIAAETYFDKPTLLLSIDLLLQYQSQDNKGHKLIKSLIQQQKKHLQISKEHEETLGIYSPNISRSPEFIREFLKTNPIVIDKEDVMTNDPKPNELRNSSKDFILSMLEFI
ncbi:hypothetical protein DLAC_05808 [Tieghemostelium lacteum]|uniref:Uncharacterized protein n=1 Tax=Tieghemostelium lacteum TaxID=361077 RepID=A0A151ZH31_TIELA|nr:hypothetical protein DLAC_05808 [Tieghemostelium lacteum]|eukprot:KYQ93174.1 hypothetical protein DLAC_05808 [Tieghemostelium lacteum]